MPGSPTPSGPVALLLSKLKHVKAQAGGWVALCPAHDDRSRSLKVDVGRDGRALATCFTGCSFKDILGSVGLSESDMFTEDTPRSTGTLALHRPPQRAPRPEPAPVSDDERRHWPIVKAWDYVDADGELVFQVLRMEQPNPPTGRKPQKFFSQRQKGPAGWTYGLKGIDARPLYRLPELLEDIAADRVLVLVEGEKACDAVRALGFPGVAHMGGAKAWRDEYAKQLESATIVILPDNDQPGREWAVEAGESLIAQGCTVRMLALPVVDEKDDVVEWIERGGTRESLSKLLDRAVPWSVGDPVPLPPGPSRLKVYSVTDLEALPALEWMVGEDGAGILPAGALLGMFGAPGAGKSFVAADLACTIAASRRTDAVPTWFGNAIRRGPVLYIAAEGGRGFRHRVLAWRERYHVDAADLSLYFVLEPVNLYGPDDVTHILRAADALPQAPELIVFDTVARSMVGGDENSAQDMGLVIDRGDRVKRETGGAVLFVHHARKDSDIERGSGALRAGVDTLCLVREDEESGRVLACEKQKDADEFLPMTFWLHPIGDSCVVSTQPPTGPRALTSNQRAALKTLADLFPKGASSTEWNRGCGIADRTFYRVRAWLVREGYVSEWQAGNSTRYSIQPSGHWALNGQVM